MKLLNLPFDEKIILIKQNKYLDILIYYVQHTAIEYCKNHPIQVRELTSVNS